MRPLERRAWNDFEGSSLTLPDIDWNVLSKSAPKSDGDRRRIVIMIDLVNWHHGAVNHVS